MDSSPSNYYNFSVNELGPRGRKQLEEFINDRLNTNTATRSSWCLGG